MMVALAFSDTARREVVPFEPIDPDNVRMYVCGPTVYDEAHIGNARPVVVFDVLFRLLRSVYGAAHVTYARNITDIDDKIIQRAAENNEPIGVLTARVTEGYTDNMRALACLDPSIQPRATEHIPQMIAMIERLIAGGHAYAAEGHALFAVRSFAEYGALSGRSIDEQVAGARVEVAPYKRDPADFVLWKPSTGDQPGWDSPWGRGRPGWHLECSAMSAEHLGETFDIHGGGLDLIFPHHENEIAQTCCSFGEGRPDFRMARHWMHNGFLTVAGAKMSKSLGNFTTVTDLRKAWHGEVIRLALMLTHYTAPLDLSEDRLKEAKALLDGWHRAWAKREGEVGPKAPAYIAKVQEFLGDDLNTTKAIAQLSEFSRFDNINYLFWSAKLLGFFGSQSPEAWFKWAPPAAETETDQDIHALIAARIAARKAKNFAEADRIRDDLQAKGIILEDGPAGTTWRRA
jgi:cysteinyl-tRNA synthetase